VNIIIYEDINKFSMYISSVVELDSYGSGSRDFILGYILPAERSKQVGDVC
jgi:hypothetical protein